jgi:EAL domain-containing protein (putative c-di-GMP-specific phosphodiesterase class I)
MEVTGYEILAHWPERGVIMPEIFVPIAEATGTISDMTCSLLRRATEDAAGWPQSTTLPLNLSARQLSNKWLAKKLLGVMTERGFAPKRLEVEVTERAMMERIEDAKSLLQSFRNIGVKVALDHLVTGLSGLHHLHHLHQLRELPFDRAKINRSFVGRMMESTEETKIVAVIVRLCRVLGLQTTAEGIETQEVLDRLIGLGCESGQGFLLGKPEPQPVCHDIDQRNIA